MQAAAPPSDSDTVSTGPQDWLGYQRYADALWARIVHHFALDADARSAAKGRAGERRDLPTGDPLVVGVYGEWGVGKSRLLELMYQLAARQNVEDCLQRARDPQAYAASPALRLTVPVWFHPWKYEHEPHLAVPLLMHLAEAVQRTLGQTASFQEQALALIDQRSEDAAALATQVKKVAKTFQAAAKVAHKVAGNELVKTTASLAAGYFGFGKVADRALDWVEETAGKFLPAAEDGDKAPNKDASKEDPNEAKEAKPHHATPEASADGRYYYNVHRYLSDLTRIDSDRAKALGFAHLKHDIQLNFVVFVDDLDRCLPEKAVEVLEVIKTVLNVDSFAFVIALDDEVIERGISYRYREYRFQNAKPEMPITGFEYLEKIVHLPFRLPQLTRAEAVRFLFKQEQRLLTPTASDPALATQPGRLWFLPDPVTGELQASPLVHLLLDSFDAFVPRKLNRSLELMHQFQQVFAARGTPIQPPPAGFSPTGSAADARMMLFCVLLQLFAPEIFRLLRRRPELFGHWMRAYLVQDTSRHPVFVWQKTAGDQLMTLEVSDADLYRWVALGSGAGALQKAPPPGQMNLAGDGMPFTHQRDEWGRYLGGAQLSGSDRYSVEQVRLPLAAALSGFREMQRHAFAPLRLGGAMAYATGWTAGAVPRLQEYLNLFSDQLMPAAAPSITPAPPAPPQTPVQAPVAGLATAPSSPEVSAPPPVTPAAPPTFQLERPVRQVNPSQLLELMASADASTRASIVERLGLQPGEVVDAAAVKDLAARMNSDPNFNVRRALEALAALAPFLEPQTVVQAGPWPIFPPPSFEFPQAYLDACQPVATLAAHLLANPLGLGVHMESLRPKLLRIVNASELQLPMRSVAADQLGAVGDPRFDFDPAIAWLPRQRAQVQPNDHEPVRASRPPEEPVPGFLRIQPYPQSSSEGVVVSAEYVYLGRTLVTVRQYEAFMDADGYAHDELWDADGLAWRTGGFDASMATMMSSMPPRPVALRRLPWRWAEQRLTPARPVVGICWYEARAYANWLDGQLQQPRHKVRLPTEHEWERGVRMRSSDRSDDREWPWSRETLASAGGPVLLANIDATRLGHSTTVGLFPPNPIGLYDLAGNVWEWMDNLLPSPDQPPRRIDTGAPLRYLNGQISSQPGISLRGGSWQSSLDDARRGVRVSRMPWEHDDTVGMRVALVPTTPASPA